MKMEFIEAINKNARSVVNEIHTAFPGMIMDIDYDKGTCSVQPYALMKTVTGENMMYPVIYNVPIVVPQSSVVDACIAYPVKPGDGCLVVVSEGTLDYWLYNRVTKLDSKFDITNAVCIPGLSRAFNPCFKEAAEDGAIILKYGDGKLKLTSENVEIQAKNLTINATNKLTLKGTNNVEISGARVDIN